jgi:tRNA pseudouridine55 synthase
MTLLNGIINVNKPAGITSMDVIRRIKRVSVQKRIGHGGTLDPMATGVIPICLGQATRVMEYIVSGTKQYKAQITLGVETTTYDRLGEIVQTKRVKRITHDSLVNTTNRFVGEIEQVPPMFSALKHRGKRLYELARKGITIERESRKVKISNISILKWNPPHLSVEITCGKGFYVRSFAHDLGQSLGCGGHLSELVRTKNGALTIQDAIPLVEVEKRLATNDLKGILRPLDFAIEHIPATVVDSKTEDMILNGKAVPNNICVFDTNAGDKYRVYSSDGTFLAIMSYESELNHWQPNRVFSLR